MSHNNKNITFRHHTILVIQLISFAIALSPVRIAPPFSALSYCLAVFTSPILLLSCYCSYLNRTEKWFLESIPCVAEAIFSILYISAMIYGIRFYSNSLLFSWLLSVYLVDFLLCTLWCLSFYTAANISVTESC